MPSYTDTFGGATVNPALLSYISYTTDVNLTLVWPLEAPQNANVAADKIDVIAVLNNLGVTVPPADQVSVGQDILFRNPGTHTFFVYDHDGIQIGQVGSGEAWYFVLIDNDTVAGVWYAIQFGVGTSSATAASLAGAGLRANANALDQNLLTNALIANYTIGIGDRATVLQNAGGAVVYIFGSASVLGNGFFVYVINAGTGSVVLTPAGGQTIDGAATKTLAPSESAAVFSDGSNLHTLGYGRSLVNTVTGASINVAGTGVLALSSSQIAAQIQDWSGTLTGNRILDYGGGVGYWFVWNNSAGAFTVTARVNGLDAGTIVPQGAFSIIRSNGTNMKVAFTATSGTVTEVDTTTDLTGGPISTTGTLGLSNTGVAAGTYGDASHIPTLSISTAGRITAASQSALSIANSVIVASAALRAVISDPTGTGSLVFANSPALTGVPTAPTAAPGDNTTELATTAFVTAAVAAAVAAAIASQFATGDFLHTSNPTPARTGWIVATGSIGSAASAATTLANATASPLYTVLWNGYSDALCPVSGGRGVSAAADFAANKTLTMLDARGMVLAAAENMGGTNRGNLGTNASTGGFAATASLGANAGQKAHTPTIAEMAAHVHTPAVPNSAIAVTGGLGIAGGPNTPTPSTGGGADFNVTQPTLVCNILIKL